MDTQLLSYRLKSVRRKRRLVIADRDKQLLKLDRERQRIVSHPDYKQTVPLDEPYQKGWKRLFVLSADVQKSADAEFYQQILDAINTVQYHYDQSFKKPKRKGCWHKYWFDELPKLKTIGSYYWQQNTHGLSEQQRACFNRVDFWDNHYYRRDHYYEFASPGLFTIAITPHIIDTIKVGDGLLAQQEAWIDNHIENHGLQYRLSKISHGRKYRYWKSEFEKLKYRNPLKNKSICDLGDL